MSAVLFKSSYFFGSQRNSLISSGCRLVSNAYIDRKREKKTGSDADNKAQPIRVDWYHVLIREKVFSIFLKTTNNEERGKTSLWWCISEHICRALENFRHIVKSHFSDSNSDSIFTSLPRRKPEQTFFVICFHFPRSLVSLQTHVSVLVFTLCNCLISSDTYQFRETSVSQSSK